MSTVIWITRTEPTHEVIGRVEMPTRTGPVLEVGHPRILMLRSLLYSDTVRLRVATSKVMCVHCRDEGRSGKHGRAQLPSIDAHDFRVV